jgi:hypothetical protein
MKLPCAPLMGRIGISSDTRLTTPPIALDP